MTSLWNDYIGMLPKLPLAADTSTTLDVNIVLEGSLVGDAVRTAVQNVAESVAALMASLPLLEPNATYAGGFGFSTDEAVWAVSMVKSRTFDLFKVK